MSKNVFRHFESQTEETMNDKEQLTMLIDKFSDLQRIKAAKTPEQREKEIDLQIKVTAAKLQAFGIVTEELEIH